MRLLRPWDFPGKSTGVGCHCLLWIHLCSSGQLDCFHILAVLNNAAVSIGVHVSFRTSAFVFRKIFRSGIDRSYGSSISNFLRNFHTLFHSGYSSLHSHQQCKRVPLFPHPCQQLSFVVFLLIAILTGVRWYLLVIPAFDRETHIETHSKHLFSKYILRLIMGALKILFFSQTF